MLETQGQKGELSSGGWAASVAPRVVSNYTDTPAGPTVSWLVTVGARLEGCSTAKIAAVGFMDSFVEQLALLCRDHVTRNKWVFVSSHALGHTLGERIALGGTSWLNLRFVTPLDVALRMGAPFLVERGIEPSEEGLGPALIMRLLLDLPEQGGYFRPLADQPTLAQALWTTIRELRMAGIKSADLKAEAFASPE